MIQIKSLASYGIDELFDAFSQAFADYEITLDKDELQKMLHRRGFNAQLSFGAFDNDRLASFTFNGIGMFNGQKTAYDTGTGTLKEYRGKGLASQVFSESIPHLINAGVKQYLLEVLQHNVNAVSIYKKQGFEVSREFNYFKQSADKIVAKNKPLPGEYFIREISLSNIRMPSICWDFYPSWQNSFDAIYRKSEDFLAFGAFLDNLLVGYGILEPSSGDITQLVVDKQHRRRGLGSAILDELIKHNSFTEIKHINTEISCESITKLMENYGIALRGQQFEMVKKLI